MAISDYLKNFLLAIIFILPLLQAQRSYGYEYIKILFFVFSISLIGLFWLGKGFKWTLISKLAGLFILVLLIASLAGINLQNSLLGKQPYFQGVIFYSYLYLFYLMVKTFKIEITEYAVILSTSVLIVSLLAIGQWVQLNLLEKQIPTYAGRVVSSFGQPNFYAGFLLLSLPLSYLLFKTNNKKLQILGWGGGLVSIVAILVSYSRSAILLMLFLLVLALVNQVKNKIAMFLVVFLILLITVLFSFQSSLGIIGNELISPLKLKSPYLLTDSLEKRIYIWPILWQQFIKKPILGYGLENISKAFSSYKAPVQYWEPFFLAAKDLLVDRSHNYILDLLLFSGFLGPVIWLILLFLLIRKTRDSILLTGLLTYFVWVQFQNQSIVHLMYFWLLAGLIDS